MNYQKARMLRRFDENANGIGINQLIHQESEKRIKCVLIGDGGVGKTTLIVSYTTNGFPHEYIPTAFDNYSVVVTVDNQPIQVQLCDTAGQDDFDEIRPLCYPGVDVFLLCFNIACPTSFKNLEHHWIGQIKHHSSPDVPMLVVGAQADLRLNLAIRRAMESAGQKLVTEREARAMAKRIGAIGYLECSALTQYNLKQVFDEALLAAINYQSKSEKQKKNSISKLSTILQKPSGTKNGNANSISAKSPENLGKKNGYASPTINLKLNWKCAQTTVIFPQRQENKHENQQKFSKLKQGWKRLVNLTRKM